MCRLKKFASNKSWGYVERGLIVNYVLVNVEMLHRVCALALEITSRLANLRRQNLSNSLIVYHQGSRRPVLSLVFLYRLVCST